MRSLISKNPISKEVGREYQLYGFRAKINFRSLLKCLAVRNKRKEVTLAEFEEFQVLSEYLNFRYNPI